MRVWKVLEGQARVGFAMYVLHSAVYQSIYNRFESLVPSFRRALNMTVRMPDLYNNYGSDYSFKEISILIKKNLALLATEHWVVRMYFATSDSVTGGKLRHYRTIKADPNPSPYLLVPLGPGQRWVVGSFRVGCLPLAVETGRYRSPKCPWWTGFAYCAPQDVWKMKFTL